jgi:hypothetical protein
MNNAYVLSLFLRQEIFHLGNKVQSKTKIHSPPIFEENNVGQGEAFNDL